MSKHTQKTGGPRGLRTTQTLAPNKVKMKFKEDKFYKDRHTPVFVAGRVYELEGAAWIQRWLIRGGEIVEDARPPQKPAVDPSVIIPKSGAPADDKKTETKETTPTQGKVETKPETKE